MLVRGLAIGTFVLFLWFVFLPRVGNLSALSRRRLFVGGRRTMMTIILTGFYVILF